MIFWVIAGAVLLAAVLVFLLAPAQLKIVYQRQGEDDYMAVEAFLFWGLLPMRLESGYMQSSLETSPPAVKTKGKIAGKKTGTVAAPEKTFSCFQICRFIRKIRYYVQFFSPAMRYMGNKTRLVQFSWETELGLENAASTGMAAGALWTVKGVCFSALCRMVGGPANPPHLSVKPIYNKKKFITDLNCIFEISPGYIMISTLKVVKLWLFSRSNSGSEKKYARPISRPASH